MMSGGSKAFCFNQHPQSVQSYITQRDVCQSRRYATKRAESRALGNLWDGWRLWERSTETTAGECRASQEQKSKRRNTKKPTRGEQGTITITESVWRSANACYAGVVNGNSTGKTKREPSARRADGCLKEVVPLQPRVVAAT